MVLSLLQKAAGLIGSGGHGRSSRTRYRKPEGFLYLIALAFAFAQGCGLQPGPRPPSQPASGPGGADYKHESVVARRTGEGPTEFWIFTPDDPQPTEAPFVVFLHGWGAMHPRAYGAWIQHIVRKGHIVVYPRYQYEDEFRTPGEVMLAGAAEAIQDAWALLNAEGPVTPLPEKMAYIGHSMGGLLSAKIAANAEDLGIPPAGALLIVQPGGQDTVPVGDLSAMPEDAVVEIMTGDEDSISGQAGALEIRDALADSVNRRVELIRMRSERRSRPDLIASHFAPLGVTPDFPPVPIIGGDAEVPGNWLQERLRECRQNSYEINALEYFGFWKIGDALLDATFRGENLEFGFGGTDAQRFMGTLSDGTPVTPLLVE